MTPQLDEYGTTRRQVLRGALAGGAVAAATVGWTADSAAAESRHRRGIGSAGGAEPRPIPFANDPGIGNVKVHTFLPERGVELSTITDFRGSLGVASVLGTGTETNLRTGETRTGLPYSVDVRFFEGQYVGKDGRFHHGTFSFV